MRRTFSIPGYSRLSPRRRQIVNLVLGGTAFATLAIAVSGLVGGGPQIKTAAPAELPKPRPLSTVPGAQLDSKDAWVGGAGKDIARLKDELKDGRTEINLLREELNRSRDQIRGELNLLRERGGLPPIGNAQGAPGAAAPASSAGGGAPAAAVGVAPVVPSPAVPLRLPVAGAGTAPPPVAGNAPAVFPSQRRLAAGSAGGYPPGTPNGAAPMAAAAAEAEPPAPVLMRVSLKPAPAGDAAASSPGATSAAPVKASPVRTVSNFLPVSFTPAVLLGGALAPTGGQAQSNPVPMLFRLTDLAMLPNGFRSQVKDCLATGEGHGDYSAERAYVRMLLLSCVTHDGRVLEVPIRGSAFDQDGMNGLAGRLITKQGAILGNALVAGFASGIGAGIAQATTTTSTTALGAVTTNPTDAASILKQGLGTGIGRAMDRLAQYYISLAERTFPVIEVQPGRYVDIVINQGTALDVPLGTTAPSSEGLAPTRGSAADRDRSALLRSVNAPSDDD